MNKNWLYIIMICVIVAALSHAIYTHVLPRYLDATHTYKGNQESLPRIAKVGKIIGTNIYINSIPALDKLYKSGFRHFLLNINYTSDGKWVCMGNWQRQAPQIFVSYRGSLPMTNADFRKLPTRNNERPCEYSEVYAWMQNHPDTQITLNISSYFSAAINAVKTNGNLLMDRFVIIASNENDANLARNNGFKHVDIHLASFPGWNDEEIAYKQITSISPEHVIIPEKNIKDFSNLIKKLWEQKISVIANSVNDCETLKTMVAHGVNGVYTDMLSPSMCK